MQQKLLSLKELARILGVSERTVFRMMGRREIEGTRIGRVWRFDPAVVEGLVEGLVERREGTGAPG